MASMPITITMTSKGQITLPARIRKAMALNQRGDKLILGFEPDSRQVVLTKPMSFVEIQAKELSSWLIKLVLS